MYFRVRRKTAGDVSLEDPIDTDRDGNSLTLMELMSDEEDIIGRLDLTLKAEKLRRIFGILEPREQQVLRLYIGGDSYAAIAQKLSLRDAKSVDNTLQRIRKKLKSFS